MGQSQVKIQIIAFLPYEIHQPQKQNLRVQNQTKCHYLPNKDDS